MIEVKFPTEIMTEIKNEHVTFSFLPTGDIRTSEMQHIMLNQLVGNPIDGGLQNIYLRIHSKNKEIISQPLLGVQSESEFSVGEKQAAWQGNWEGIAYKVIFRLSPESIWFWDIELEGQDDREIDVLFTQDVGLASRGSLQANEAYVAQYLDFTVHETESGYVLCNRQNQAQGQIEGEDAFPYFQHGSLTPTNSYSTDGYQFFGTNYRENQQPVALKMAELPSEILQFEFSYVALQSSRNKLKEKLHFTFYGASAPTHKEAVMKPIFTKEKIEALYDTLEWETLKPFENQQRKRAEWKGNTLETKELTSEELDSFYPNRKQEEVTDGLLSFFTEKDAHVVLKKKEEQIERPHGLVMFSNQELTIEKPVLSTTSWMYGIFNAQTVLGNTTMNKFLSNARNAMNIMHVNGQRVYVKVDGEYRLLAMPSAFEMDFQSVRWLYKLSDDILEVTNTMHTDSEALLLEVKSLSHKAYEFYVTNQVVMGESEYQAPFIFEQKADGIYFRNSEGSLFHQVLPGANYRLKVNNATATVRDEKDMVDHAKGGEASLFNLQIEETSDFQVEIRANVEEKTKSLTELEWSLSELKEKTREFWKKISNHFEFVSQDEEANKFNTIFPWYVHNMFVHYLVPHGLEQYGGAAWGTRDVSQGPAEFFLSLQRYDIVRDILLRIFSHQFEDDGNWPQWFMFDEYVNIHDNESHGDIIVWPLRILADYLVVSGDMGILDEKIPYLSRETNRRTEEKYGLIEHVEKELDYINNNFLHTTTLSSYGNGDWDDTLQPHDQSLKKYMASSWTVALTHQALKTFVKVLEKDSVYEKRANELKQLVENIERDYRDFILTDNVIPGFVYLEDLDSVEKMIHPTDEKTGVQYRLLPMIQSITSELFTPEEAKFHDEIIDRELSFPDGVRLMNKPAAYNGGVSRNFKRAEQAANFGREIGLLYVHAHIRYVEAMAKVGNNFKAWNGLLKINPVLIQETVANATLRQSNAYFSSSDANFKTRYEAREHYDELRNGDVQVKGGWRIYSSGPGIYINQLLSNILGLRVETDKIIFDPALPKGQGGLEIAYTLFGKPVTIRYEYNEATNDYITVNNEKVTGERIDNPYRLGGLQLDKANLLARLNEHKNTIVVNYQ